MHRVEKPVLREFRVERKTDEPTLQAAIDAPGEGRRDVGIHGGRFVAIEQVQESARVIGEAPAIGEVADEADARPPGSVLIGRVQPACIRQVRDVPDPDAQPSIDDEIHDRITDLRVHRTGSRDSQDCQNNQR